MKRNVNVKLRRWQRFLLAKEFPFKRNTVNILDCSWNLRCLQVLNAVNIKALMDHRVSFRIHHVPFAYQHVNGIPKWRPFIDRGLFARVLNLAFSPVVMQNGKAFLLVLDQFVADISTDFFWVDTEQPSIEFFQWEAQKLTQLAVGGNHRDISTVESVLHFAQLYRLTSPVHSDVLYNLTHCHVSHPSSNCSYHLLTVERHVRGVNCFKNCYTCHVDNSSSDLFDTEALTVAAVGASTFKRHIALLLSSCP
ncbi:hypothetical protein MTE1_4957 [Klebsiella pneumoniae JHCK1]|nr:hypothetical protein MTE1_4957 [Klebsiella pneumoniae JHCK1]